MTESVFEPSTHYDHVTAAWEHLLGDELHYGVFETGQEPLNEATLALTELMAKASRLEPGHRVLDVGCGTGAPACHIATRYGVAVTGITTSPVGVAAATERAHHLGLSDRVTFELRDGTDNGFGNGSFDRVWALESSHLMADRAAFMAECSRVLVPGGRLSLCDLIMKRVLLFAEVRARTRDFSTLRAAFGSARMDTLDRYEELADDAGILVDIRSDLTARTRPTFDRWQANARTNAQAVRERIDQEGLTSFEESLVILRSLWDDGTMGYGLMAGYRPVA